MDPVNSSTNNSSESSNGVNLPELLKKKWSLALVGILILFFLGIVLFLLSSSKPKHIVVSQPVPTASISPTLSPEIQRALNKAIEKQKKVDQEYAGWQTQARTDYPWKKHLPLRADRYYVYFDMDKKAFIGLIYPKASDDVEEIKSYVTRLLDEKQIPWKNYKIEWTIK